LNYLFVSSRENKFIKKVYNRGDYDLMKRMLLVILVACVCIFSFTAYLLLSKTSMISPTDVEIDGHLALNNSKVLPYRKYIIEFTVTKKKFGRAYLYPYAKSLINLTFEESEGAKIGGIGTGGDGYKTVMDQLERKKVLGAGGNKDVWGFRCPDEPGLYKFKLYYDKIAGEKIPEEAYIIYLNLENKYCFRNYWTKLVTVDFQ
jgi:hypothetical protein